MKKFFLILVFVVFCFAVKSQTKNNFAIKAEFMYGNILKHTTHLQNLVQGPTKGAELAVEWQTMGEKSWHQYIGFPKIGLGMVSLDLGNSTMLGNLYAIYPYLNFKLFHYQRFILNIKGGAGASFLTKTFNNTATNLNDLNTGNAAIGSVLNVYFAGGANIIIPIEKGFAAVADFQWNHASNGSFYQPNSGINMLNASVGVSYAPYYKHVYHPKRKHLRDLSQKLSYEFIASGGARELYYKDDMQYPIGSFVAAVYRPLGNAIRLGVGVEGFYDGVYDGTTTFQRTYLTEDKWENKIRVGVSLRPELMFGRFTAGVHLGMYVHNPLKNMEPYNEAKATILNKPMIYGYDIEKEDGWFYTRASMQYALTNHIFISLGLKTHLQKAEFIEWGLGYRFSAKQSNPKRIGQSVSKFKTNEVQQIKK